LSREDWLRWRKKGIGSSDAASLWGHGFRSIEDVYFDKISSEIKEEPSSYILELGNQYEPIARRLFSLYYNLDNFSDETFPAKNVAMADLPFMMASLDGSSDDSDEILEIKYQGKLPHYRVNNLTLLITDPHETKKNSDGRVPYKYWIQMQHQLLVTGAKKCHFISYNPKCSPVLLSCIVLPDEMFHVEHIKKCTWFWECVLNKVNPFTQIEAKPKFKSRRKPKVL